MIGLIKGLQATISHLMTRKVTVQYPDVRRELPNRSRGLIRLRMKEQLKPRCISCTFCEQICPAIAIKVVYSDKQPEKVWRHDAGAGTMLNRLNLGQHAIGMEPWPTGSPGKPAPEADGCLAAAFIGADELTPLVIARAARKNGIWLSQAFGVATFYDELGPGAPSLKEEAPLPPVHGAVSGCPAILTAGFGDVDPESIESYAKAGGYEALKEMLTGSSPQEVIKQISSSSLRGRGGSGFLAGAKWQAVSDAGASQKYIVCNGLDGDEGSFKDRALLQNSPHRIIEGMIIAAYATGASAGYLCLNAASRTAVKRARLAVEQAEERGFLGKALPGTVAGFNIKVTPLPEAFITGEETALISTLEGKRPQSRVRPPYPSQKGLFGKPTLVHNAETLATVPWILKNGAGEFKKTGAGNAPGTRLFTLQGAVNQPGIYESPMDMSLKKLVESEAGGFAPGAARGALIGGTGGGFLSQGLFDIPLDYDSLKETGGDLSSGSIQVLGESDCVLDTVRACLSFSVAQSCGKCVPDRLGGKRLLDIMERICRGEGRENDLQLAEELAEDIAAGSLCGLGRGAVKPFLTALKFFPNEFEEHVKDKKCSAKKCRMGR